MTLLATAAGLEARRSIVSGPMALLADSLAADLQPLLTRELFVPTEKARLTRAGGRCARDGSVLAFDPFNSTSHRCEQCGERYEGDVHYRWWLLWYQLWLAERAVHCALLFALRGEERHAALAECVLDAYAERYLQYPNQDNVLGPARPFFSTYLESIWTLQLCVAVDLLETVGRASHATAKARDRILAPSADLIASYDEGMSNRQVWNDAALLATGLLLGRRGQVDDAILGRSGLVSLLDTALLSDGSWYEGENYHLFAHRGLWYGVAMAENAALPLPTPLVKRFEQGFAIPFVTALPDFTFPSRRDSQYAVSLRQWRFAELCELGLARQATDARLQTALHELYDPSQPRGDTGRSRSAAEVERNAPPTRLDRTDLGWRSLLAALPQLPGLDAPPVPRSVLLEGQGLAVIRRAEGQVYVALDYGHGGGGHGHPDRLNVLLVDGATRWLDDMGTGSYVDPSLHWYRSTLAHNAPLVNGQSQVRVDGELRAWDEQELAAWVSASATIAPGVEVRRSLVVLADYAVDHLVWHAQREIDLDLPIHADGELHGVSAWRDEPFVGGKGIEDGFSFVRQSERGTPRGRDAKRLHGALGDARADVWLMPTAGTEWWRLTAPAAPGRGESRFHLLRMRGARGTVTCVWSWRGAVQSANAEGNGLRVLLTEPGSHTHLAHENGWSIAIGGLGKRGSIELAGLVPPRLRASPPTNSARPHPIALRRSPSGKGWWSEANAFTRSNLFAVELGEGQYRRSEQTWEEAGGPSASMLIGVRGAELVLEAFVRKQPLRFAPAGAVNELDNEHPDVNSDGLQLYLQLPRESGLAAGAVVGWMLVPERPAPAVRVTPIAGMSATLPMSAEWKESAGGYALHCAIPLPGVERSSGYDISLDAIVNEIPPGRERRRGQLVLSGGGGEFVYLQGDRQSPARFLRFRVER